MTLKQKILRILIDGRWHSTNEILELLWIRHRTKCVCHSQRIGDLQRPKHGLEIDTKDEDNKHWYKLITPREKIDLQTCTIITPLSVSSTPDRSSVPSKNQPSLQMLRSTEFTKQQATDQLDLGIGE